MLPQLRAGVGTPPRRAGEEEGMEQDKSVLFATMVRVPCRWFVVHDHGKDASESAEAGAA